MKQFVNTTFLALAITAIAAFGADNSLGTWKLNADKSTSTISRLPLKSLTTTREASDGGVKVTSTGEQADGTPINSSYAAKYDGGEYPVTGAPWDIIIIKRVDANNFTTEAKKTDGKYHSTGRMVISKDRKTMTMTSKGTNADGEAFTMTLVYEKQ